MATMKKLEMTGPKQSHIVEVPMPEYNDDQVLVKTKYCGVCMSEHYAWETAKPGDTFGHEPVGVVAAVGKNVTDLKIGDRVGYGGDGKAEYSVAYPKELFKIPDDVKDEEAILEPLACLISAVSKTRITIVGEKVCVVGCGYMGCGAISLLKMRGAYVVAVDIKKESLENAKQYGADEAYLTDEIPEEYRKNGFPLVMEWGETAESLDLALNLTKMCGQLAIGAYHTGGKRLVDVQQLNYKAIDCLSTHPRETEFNLECAKKSLELFAQGWNYQKVPTKVYPITKFDRAHAELPEKFGKWMKAIVDWESFDGEPYMID